IFVYGECRRNFKLTTRVLQERYPNVGYSLKIVKKVVHLFEDTSSVVKPKRVYHLVRNDPVVVETLKTAIRENAITCMRKIARENNISKTQFKES
ncbi:hypothetical protein BDFB_015055, partial [Asbolus verrucosus]